MSKQISYQELIKQEYKKCMDSPVYFMKYYVKIQHPMRGTILFDLYKFQEETLNDFHVYKNNIILKSRQMGISTLVAAYSLWMMLFHSDKKILLISLKQEVAKEVITKVRFANENLPTWLKVKCIEDNRLSLKFVNGSQINASSTTKKSGVSHALSLLIIDEAALIDDAEDLWTSAQPALSCLDKSQLVLTEKGLIRLEYLINNNTKLGFNDIQLKLHDGTKLESAISFYMSEKSDLYELKFKSGGKLICTGNHPLLTRDGWKSVELLEENKDEVLCKYNQNIFGPSIELSKFSPNIRSDAVHRSVNNEEICYLAGLWIADGHFSGKGTVGITNTDAQITKWLKRMGFKSYDERHYYINSRWIYGLLKWIGCSETSHTKRVPDRILSASFNDQVAFLQGLFDGDGCSLKNKGIKLTSASYELLSNVRAMLLNMGIYSNIRSVTLKSVKSTVIIDKSRVFKGFELHIGGFDAHLFYSKVGFKLLRKQKGKQKLPVKSIKRISECYDPIVSIKYLKHDFSYDLKVPSTERFICEGYVNHNTGGDIIILSTPRGIGNWFHKMWVGAEEGVENGVGKNTFHPINLPWHLHPDRDEEWRRIEGEKQGSHKKAAQEFDCDFLASGDSVVELAIIEFYKKNKVKDPVEVRGSDRGLWIWEYPDFTRTYIVSADVARGDGEDFAACHVLDITGGSPTQVAEYKGALGTKEFGNFLVELATMYNDALLVVERESYGWAALQQIIDREYKNTFYSSADLKYVDVQRQLTNRFYAEEKKMVPGFSTNLKTRPLIIDNLTHYFRDMAVEIRSKRTCAELETFIWKNNKAIAMDGYNDDLVMSLAIGLWIRDTALRLRQEGIDLTKATLDKMYMNKMDQTPFYKTRLRQSGVEQWNMKTGRQGIGNQNVENLQWLLE